MPSQSPRDQPKRRWRFTLPTLFAAVAIVALGFGIYAAYVAWRRDVAVRELVEAVDQSVVKKKVAKKRSDSEVGVVFQDGGVFPADDNGVPTRIVRALAEIKRLGGAQAAAKELVTRMADDDRFDWIIFKDVFDSLGAPTTPALIDALAKEEAADNAMRLLGGMLHHNRIMDRVDESLRQDPRPIVRARLIAGLHRAASSYRIFKDSHPTRVHPVDIDRNFLVTALGDESEKVRLAAACALAEVDPANARQAIPVLLASMKDPIDQLSPLGAAWALARIDPTMYPVVGPQLEKLLHDESYLVRLSAALAIREFGAEAKPAIPTLLGLLKISPGASIVEALATIGSAHSDRRVEDAFIATVGSETAKEWLRGRAVFALRGFANSSKRSLDVMIAALRDKSEEVRPMAAAGLGDVGPAARAAVPALRKALADEDSYVREWAAEALQKITKPVASK